MLAAFVFVSCNDNNQDAGRNKATPSSSEDTSKLVGAVKYTCTMHPEVISDTAGHCPKCGMEMVPIKDSTRK